MFLTPFIERLGNASCGWERNCCLCSGSGVLSDSPASPPESKTDSGPSEFRCLLTPCPTRWPAPSCRRSKQWEQITPIGSFLKMSPFPPHLRHSWISKPEGDVSVVAGTTGDSDGLRTTGHSLHSLLPTALQPWFLVSAVFVYIYICLLNPRQHVSRSKALLTPHFLPAPPPPPISSSDSSFIWSRVPAFRSRNCSNVLLLLMLSLLPGKSLLLGGKIFLQEAHQINLFREFSNESNTLLLVFCMNEFSQRPFPGVPGSVFPSLFDHPLPLIS